MMRNQIRLTVKDSEGVVVHAWICNKSLAKERFTTFVGTPKQFSELYKAFAANGCAEATTTVGDRTATLRIF